MRVASSTGLVWKAWYDFHPPALHLIGIGQEKVLFYHNCIHRRLTKRPRRGGEGHPVIADHIRRKIVPAHGRPRGGSRISLLR